MPVMTAPGIVMQCRSGERQTELKSALVLAKRQVPAPRGVLCLPRSRGELRQ